MAAIPNTSSIYDLSFRDFHYHGKSVLSAKWNCDGSYLATGSYDKTCKVGNLEPNGSLKVCHVVNCASSPSRIIWHTEDKNRFAIGGDDAPIDIWDVRAPKPAMRLTSLGHNLNLAWSGDGKYIAAANKSDNLAIFDTTTGTQLTSVKFTYEVNEFAWTANSDHLLLATGEGNVDVVQVNNGSGLSKLHSIAAHTSNCFYLKCDKNYQKMIIGGADFQLSLWDLDDLICYKSIAFDSDIRHITLNGTGEYGAVIAEDAAIYFFNSKTGEKFAAKTDREIRSPLNIVEWHPTHNILAFAPDDRTAGSAFIKLMAFKIAKTF